jgi:hypothetical protein
MTDINSLRAAADAAYNAYFRAFTEDTPDADAALEAYDAARGALEAALNKENRHD